MAAFSNRGDFEAWLVGKPRPIVVAMVSRAALSTVPYLAGYVGADPKHRAAAIMLPCFRAMAPPWFASTWPNQGGAVHAATAATAAAHAGYATAAAGHITAADSAAASVTASAASWVRLSKDAAAIDGGMSPQSLMDRPVWPDGSAPSGFEGQWRDLRRLLLSLDQDWQVWSNWYDDRLRGAAHPGARSLIAGLELERILIPNKVWDDGPSVLNARIADLEAEYR